MLVVAPAVERGEVVAAHDEAELAPGVFLLQGGEGDDGVGGNGEVHLDVAGAEAVVVVDGAAHHLHAVVVGQEGGAFLEGVLGRDDEPHFVHLLVLHHGVGNDEVPHVDGVERAEEEGGSFHQ